MSRTVPSTATPAAVAGTPGDRRRIAAWAAWDWGSAAFNAVITTFVFTRWITSDAFVDPALVADADAESAAGVTDGPARAAVQAVLAEHSSWLGWGLTAAGVLIALLAPVLGSRVDRTGRRTRRLGLLTAVTVLLCLSLAVVRPDPDALATNVVLGLTILALANITFELASVTYNGMITRVATPATYGRVSGIGWGAGYLGGIVLLLLLFVGFINPEVGWFGVTGEDGWNIRAAVLVSALWFAVFAVPVLLVVRDEPRTGPAPERLGLLASYRRLAADVRELWRHDRTLLGYLVASAVYRDGLAGVFTFGAVIASGTFGFSAGEVVVFAIAANVVAGLATFAGGTLDDRVGPRAVVVASLVGLLVTGLALFFLHDAGPAAFWVAGLLLCVFVGPAQSASRSLLTRLAPPGRTTEVFGLYATTGRAASPLAPLAFSVCVSLSGSQHWGILGLMAVLVLGLAALLPLRLRDAVRRGGVGEAATPVGGDGR
ncbi:MFS transporter [Cellulomonas marina]|uniref:MFS transporter, UMF1 family n=1 Tax=Cellulomonas marina TaxID=988821 RepID=A0A1I1AFM6_9CELL|nr:MFS transporter [Cellulomonas marina]GIG30371.1 MFS transporter [Cellulomonas marina]SFB35133.1 MFS transporter, UMF1 family [Cellulomonas marina]